MTDETSHSPVRTFLIADVRGYTRFTQERGDEAAARVAVDFAELAREAVQAHDGEVIELRGDEALCVFTSARHALRAAIELQTRFRRRTDAGVSFPLPIGIGLDSGEAVPIEGGYRGGALNTAARLCSLAEPGQILATDTAVSLARRLEGIRFVQRRPVRLKGFDRPVRLIEVVPEAALPPLPQGQPEKWPRVTSGRLAAATIAAILLAAGLVAFGVERSSRGDVLARLDANTVGVIDAERAAIEAQVTAGSRPGAIAAGGGYVWVASEADGTLSRIDPATRAVQAIAVGESASGVAYGGGSVWVANGEEGVVVQIDPDSLRAVQTIAVGNGPAALAAGGGALWVANTIDGTISRIGLGRGAVTKTITVGANPSGIAAGAGAVWVVSEGGGTVLRLDPRVGAVVDAINVGNGPTGIAVGERGVWVANRQDGTVSRIDPQTNAVSATIRAGEDPASVVVGRGAVWVANSGDETISRIDPDAGAVAETLSVKSSPQALVLAGGKVWTTTLPSFASHRGGVLRVVSEPFLCRCIDPAAPYGVPWNALSLVYDGLLAYRRVGGIAAGTLVGNLAVRVPRPTDNGRTYTFHLRRGIRYSNGTPVRPADLRYSIERMLTFGTPIRSLYAGIVGASGCPARRPRRCDLSEGIEIDERARTITIRLTEPDSDFPYKLTLPFASVVPAETPLAIARFRPIPGTGPYRIASADPDVVSSSGPAIRLVRNPHFRVWSRDARPDGYPDEIHFRFAREDEERLAVVERGDFDLISELPFERLKGLLTRHAGKLHCEPARTTEWAFLSSRVPPLDDVRVRRALNYATDRAKLAQLQGGTLGARPTCQILPPGLPGFRPYCPYTINPNPAGTWTAPDMTRAIQLVAASRTRGMRVEVLAGFRPWRRATAEYFVSLLRRLGYRSSLRPLLGLSSINDPNDPRKPAQIGPANWSAGFAAPAPFLRDLFSCAASRAGDSVSLDPSQFCDVRIDAQMRRAAALQSADPVRADALWAEVDRAIVDAAAAIPITNPREVVLVSERVGNFQFHPQWGTLLDQLWVR